MDIQIKRGRPPNYDKIVAAMPRASRPGVIFAYGGEIFVSDGKMLTQELLAHERVHCRRQGDNPDGWWEKYLTDASFRLLEEGLAHAVEYQAFCARSHSVGGRKEQLFQIARRLAGPLYGNLCTIAAAKRLILAGGVTS